MKRAVILTEEEYDELIDILRHIGDCVRSLRSKGKREKAENLVKDAMGVLHGDDSDIAELKRQVYSLECRTAYN